MATPKDQWIKIADTAKNITLPSQLDVRPSRLIIRTRTWPSGVIGVGSPEDSDLVLPQKFKVRGFKHRGLSSSEVASSGGRYQMGDIVVSGISKRPSDDPTVGYTIEQLAPPVAAQNVEVLYILVGDSPGVYTRVELNSERILSHSLVLRQLMGDHDSGLMVNARGDSEATVNG